MTPQPSKVASIGAWAAGQCLVTVTAHGYVTGNIVVISGVTTTAVNGTYTITVVDANTFYIAIATTPGAITQGSPLATQTSATNNSGKAVVLWGNYIVATSNYTAGAYVPGSPVTASNGKYTLANGSTDPECGFVLRVQGVSATQTAHLVIVAY
jgi:hypothetical protein